jgi:pyridoxine 4-dehydrogenase
MLAGRRVARIGFGAMQLAERPGGRPAAGRETAVAVLRSAVAQGVNHIDTAQFYAAGACNELIRAALHPYPRDLVLVSKVGAEHDDRSGHLVSAQRPEQLRAGVEASLASLGIDRLAAVNLRRAHSILDRSSEPVLDLCREHELAWVPFFPLGSAFPGRPKVTDHRAVVAAAASLGAKPAQVGLAWQLAHYSHTLLIPGTASPAHLDENIAAGSLRLDPATIETLDRLITGAASS